MNLTAVFFVELEFRDLRFRTCWLSHVLFNPREWIHWEEVMVGWIAAADDRGLTSRPYSMLVCPFAASNLATEYCYQISCGRR